MFSHTRDVVLCNIPVCVSIRYGLRYTAKVLRDALQEKFPQAGEDELYKVRLSNVKKDNKLFIFKINK